MNIRNPIHTFVIGVLTCALFFVFYQPYNSILEHPALDSAKVYHDSVTRLEGQIQVLSEFNKAQAEALADTAEEVALRNEVARLERRLSQVRAASQPQFTSSSPAYQFLKERAGRK